MQKEPALIRDPQLITRLKESIQFVDQKIEAAENDERPFVLAVCGTFSSGKTSFVNTLLGKQIMLPTGNFPITKVITRITYAPALKIHLINDLRHIKRELTLEEAEQIAKTELSEQDLGSTYLHIELPAPFLKKNIMLIDTPGFNDDVDKKLDAVTIREIKQSDFCLLMFSAVKFGTKDERAFLEEMNTMTDGWFMPVLSCMNLVNTEENEKELMERADYLFKKIGNKQIGFGKYFPVCTLPGEVDLDGLDSWLSEMITNQSVYLRHIMPLQHAQYEMKNISDNAAAAQAQIWELMGRIQQQNNESIAEKKRRSRVNLAPIRQACTQRQALLQNEVIPNVCRKFQDISLTDFVPKATQALRQILLPFADAAQKEIGRNISPSLRRRFEGELAIFAIPEPVRHVRQRGFFESLLYGNEEITYNAFAREAENAVKSKLLPRLHSVMNDFLLDAEDQAKSNARQRIMETPDSGELRLWHDYLEELSDQLLVLSGTRQKVLRLLRSYS